MIPLKDDNPTSTFPIITILIILINCAVYLYTDIFGVDPRQFIARYAVIPYDIVTWGDYSGRGAFEAFSTLITSQFLHGGFLHIAGNMLFLWIFGNNVEDRFGHLLFIIFYLLCGIAGALAQVLGNTVSELPMLGASGAIAGVMGAYLLMFPRARVLTLIWIVFIIRLIWIPAGFIIGYWIIIQVVLQVLSTGQQGGVAYLAHIGGFGAGAILCLIFRAFTRKKNYSY